MSLIELTITSNAQDFCTIRRFDSDLSIYDLKTKLEILTGISPSAVVLELRDDKNELISKLQNDNDSLDKCGMKSGLVVHCIDPTGGKASIAGGDADENSDVPKFELSEEAYAQRTDSVLQWKKKQRLGRFDEAAKEKEEERLKVLVAESQVAASHMQVGQRCETRVNNQPKRRGTVAFIGTTDFKPGHWVGIKYDEPVGRNDGTVGGKRYFECSPKYGGFVRPQDLDIGDYPEECFDDDLDEM